jgi:hypothetical protein
MTYFQMKCYSLDWAHITLTSDLNLKNYQYDLSTKIVKSIMLFIYKMMILLIKCICTGLRRFFKDYFDINLFRNFIFCNFIAILRIIRNFLNFLPMHFICFVIYFVYISFYQPFKSDICINFNYYQLIINQLIYILKH